MKEQNTKYPLFTEEETEILPLNQSETIPSNWCTSEEILNFELQAIFSKEWLLIGHVNQLNETGSYIIGEAVNNPVVVVKDNGNNFRAFFNVCRHRGGPIAIENGCGKMLQCKYHGWTYTLEGMLRGVPRFDRVDLFDKKDYGLIPLNLEIWEGLIFVNLFDNPGKVNRQLQGISKKIMPYDLKTKQFHTRVVYEVNCNWKVYVDNYLEGYHVPFVHPELTKFLDYKEYKTEIFEKYSLQFSPLNDDFNYLKKEGGAFYYFFYPNIMFNILPGRLQANIIIPVSFNKTKVIFDYFYDDNISEKALKIIFDDLQYSDKIQKEDIEICELVQKGLESKAYKKGRFSVECEEGVYHFQSLLKKSYKSHRNN